MKVSVLQPRIVRGDVEHNVGVVNRLLQESEGTLNVLAEYALTGSLVLDGEANPWDWAKRCESAVDSLILPAGKHLLLNRLKDDGGTLYNESRLLPTGQVQRKCFPDPAERRGGIRPGGGFPLFALEDRTFKVIICSDLKGAEAISTEGADFALFVFHFTTNNQREAMDEAKALSAARGLPIVIASLCSDKNCGHSACVNGNAVVGLGNAQGILEIEL